MFVLLGMSHKTASLEVREQWAFAPQEIPAALESLKSQFPDSEVALLSTCNRTEIYATKAKSEALLAWWERTRAGRTLVAIQPYVYHYEGIQAVKHLMRVACGLDSMVIGEPQILGQLKEAKQAALEEGTLGKYLKRLFQHTFKVAKRVRTDTGISKHPISIAYLAVRLACQIFENLSEMRVLLLGAGKTSALCAEHFKRQGVRQLAFAHRHKERAVAVAASFAAEAFALDELLHILPSVDIVIAATATSVPILGKGAIEHALKCRKQKPMFLIDLGVPRNIESQAQELEPVYLYTIETLETLIQEHQQLREACKEPAEVLIAEQAEEFFSWVRLQKVVPTVCAYRHTMEEIKKKALDLAFSKIDQGVDPKLVMQQLAHHLSQKFLHTPTVRLKEEA